ncbi:TIGR03118 family protein [Methylomonas montana]|uniref:TIGR03118 family protein n=1 Tax=Methylomonas montana TaxID=3058963 RepID=UPI002658CECE|nr:TIGR03118 family protein [Methylomonas montana]WKJ89982.1 TIGR03118 family protein [Methylomonas montana]
MNSLLKSLFFEHRVASVLMFVLVMACGSQAASAATSFGQINLVTDDQTANPAQVADTNLKNPWGVSYRPAGPFWVSNNATGTSSLYNVDPATNATTPLALVVSIPGAGNVTGQVSNGNPQAFNGDPFLFVSEDGTVSGWRNTLGTTAETIVTGAPNKLYKGVAEATVAGNSYLYAANFGTGAIDVIKGSAGAADLGNFTDPNLPSGYAPFNIQSLGDKLYVAYALKDNASPDEVAGAGLGFVSVFDFQGNFLDRVASGGVLNAPWGLAIAPSSFGEFAGNLLVGNFGDGTINAYNLLNNSFAGQLTDGNGQALKIDGLWALTVGNDGNAGSSQRIYFTAGPGGEAHGLFGAITVVPVPAAFWLFGSVLLGFGVFGKRQSLA